MNDIDKLIEDQLKTLPESLQKALDIVPWSSTVKEIALLNKLNLEQVEAAERETMFIIYGLENPEDYIENLAREAQIDEATAISIAKEVNEKVLDVLARKADEFEKQPVVTPAQSQSAPSPAPVAPSPEPVPHNLPMVEKGEVVHDATPMTATEKASIPKAAPEEPRQAWARKPWSASEQTYKYPGGKDPYREPLV